jgi:protein SCO1/2
MVRLAAVLTLALLVACAKEAPAPPVTDTAEKLYTVRGTILSRRAADNSLHMDHEEIPGFMPAMRMDYLVRGTDVGKLPPDGKRIEARLHVTGGAYWLTDIKQIP